MTEKEFEKLKIEVLEQVALFSDMLKEMSLKEFTSETGFTQLASLRTQAAEKYSTLIIGRNDITSKR